MMEQMASAGDGSGERRDPSDLSMESAALFDSTECLSFRLEEGLASSATAGRRSVS